jgi:cytosine/adenosine deaminase-related metal-dependent hydrolase
MKKIIRAQWLLPISRPPIKDGAILIEGNRILNIGASSTILRRFKAPLQDLGSVILLPGLVNAHSHLEYSCLKDKIKPKKNFKDWIVEIVELKKKIKDEQILKGIFSSIRDLQKSGTVLLGETTNTGLSINALKRSGLSGTIFYELVGNNPFEDYLKIEKKFPETSSLRISVSCHAPHSVPHSLISEVGRYLRKTRKTSSIHLGESLAEVQWIKEKKGPFSKLIHKESLIQNPDLGKKLGPFEYLKKKRFLNAKILCVHCIHLSQNEMEGLRKCSCFVALCPRSNAYTGAGKAPVKKFISLQVPLCLGTDSLASNEDLDLWKEMKTLKKFFPFLSYHFILRMATLNGARALGFEKTHGSIEPGKKASFIYIKTDAKKILNPYKYLFEKNHAEIHSYPSSLWANDPF